MVRTGTFGANSFRQTLGLGEAESLLELEVVWAGSGRRQIFTDIPLDSFVQIREGWSEPRRVSLP